jgi:hypothetical protein
VPVRDASGAQSPDPAPLGFKAKIADGLVAQSCIDHDGALSPRGNPFCHLAEHCGLKPA